MTKRAMKAGTRLAVWVAAMAVVAGASAQFTPAGPPRVAGTGGFALTGRNIDLNLGFYPYVRFEQGDFLRADGSMFWLSKDFRGRAKAAAEGEAAGEAPTRFRLGGWYVFRGINNAWQIQGEWLPGGAKNPSYQVAVLGGSNPEQRGKYDHSLFVIVPAWNGQLLKRYNSSFTVGLGAYGYSATGDGYKTSGFANFTTTLDDAFSLDLSYWLVEGPGQGVPGILRYGLGLSYRFATTPARPRPRNTEG